MRTKMESLQLQLDFEEIINDDKKTIQRLRKEIRDLKIKIILNRENGDNDKEYFD